MGKDGDKNKKKEQDEGRRMKEREHKDEEKLAYQHIKSIVKKMNLNYRKTLTSANKRIIEEFLSVVQRHALFCKSDFKNAAQEVGFVFKPKKTDITMVNLIGRQVEKLKKEVQVQVVALRVLKGLDKDEAKNDIKGLDIDESIKDIEQRLQPILLAAASLAVHGQKINPDHHDYALRGVKKDVGSFNETASQAQHQLGKELLGNCLNKLLKPTASQLTSPGDDQLGTSIVTTPQTEDHLGSELLEKCYDTSTLETISDGQQAEGNGKANRENDRELQSGLLAARLETTEINDDGSGTAGDFRNTCLQSFDSDC